MSGLGSAGFLAFALALLPVPGALGQEDPLVADFFPYRAFERLPGVPLHLTGGTLVVAFGPGELQLSRDVVLEWVRRSAGSVVTYFGRLPTDKSQLLIIVGSGSGVRRGTTWGHRGAASRIVVGRDTTKGQLGRDWILVHELVHQAFPSVSDEHHWMEEGLATYVEPIARAQANSLPAEEVWAGLVKGLPSGLPGPGDQGLDRTPTWGRTYWGGALFYLLADIEIRRRTDNRRGLQDALRAIVAAGGNITNQWPVEQVLRTADRATGTNVLTKLYADMKHNPVQVDLDDLWRQLGVVPHGATVSFDDSAPLSAVRRAITAR